MFLCFFCCFFILFVSGCITSAEALLIQEQSTNKLLEILQEKNKIVIISISSQSIASIASFTNQSQIETYYRLVSFFKLLGVNSIIDTSSASDISLIQERKEFFKRFFFYDLLITFF